MFILIMQYFLYTYVLSTLKYHRSCHPNWTTTQKKLQKLLISSIRNWNVNNGQLTSEETRPAEYYVLYTNQHYNQLSQLSSELYDLFLESSQQKKKKMILSSMLCADSSSSKFNFLTHFSRPSTGSNVSL